jgi:hypothetical protein
MPEFNHTVKLFREQRLLQLQRIQPQEQRLPPPPPPPHPPPPLGRDLQFASKRGSRRAQALVRTRTLAFDGGYARPGGLHPPLTPGRSRRVTEGPWLGGRPPGWVLASAAPEDPRTALLERGGAPPDHGLSLQPPPAEMGRNVWVKPYHTHWTIVSHQSVTTETKRKRYLHFVTVDDVVRGTSNTAPPSKLDTSFCSSIACWSGTLPCRQMRFGVGLGLVAAASESDSYRQ